MSETQIFYGRVRLSNSKCTWLEECVCSGSRAEGLAACRFSDKCLQGNEASNSSRGWILQDELRATAGIRIVRTVLWQVLSDCLCCCFLHEAVAALSLECFQFISVCDNCKA